MKVDKVKSTLNCLSNKEKLLLRDIILFGECSSGDIEFLNDDYVIVCEALTFRVKDAVLGGNFDEIDIRLLSNSIFRTICNRERIGVFITFVTDYFPDGCDGDILCIRKEYLIELEIILHEFFSSEMNVPY